MKAVYVIALLGGAVLVGGLLIARDLGATGEDTAIQSEWRPAKQVTLKDQAGRPRSLHVQPDTEAVKALAFERLGKFHREWDDAVRLAESTPRIQLSGPVRHLQELARSGASMDLSECLEAGRPNFAAALDAQAQKFIAFMGQDNRRELELVATSTRELENWRVVVQACR